MLLLRSNPECLMTVGDVVPGVGLGLVAAVVAGKGGWRGGEEVRGPGPRVGGGVGAGVGGVGGGVGALTISTPGLLAAFRDFLRRVEGTVRGDTGWHEELHRWLRFVNSSYQRGDLGREELERWRGELGMAFNGVQTCQGLAWARRRGGSLDAAVLDRIESRWTSSDPGLAKWDDLFHGEPGIRAVRSRREQFQAWLSVREERSGGRSLRVLDLGCGPGWHLASVLAGRPGGLVRFVAVDGQTEAVARAREVTRGGMGRVEFVCADPIRHVPVGGVNLVWSAGVLERLSDRLAVTWLARLWETLPLGGEMALGSLGLANPSRPYLEVLLGWTPYHRSGADLLELARQAGIPAGLAEVGGDSQGVGQLLQVRKPV